MTVDPVPINTLVVCEFPAVGLGLCNVIDTRKPTLASRGLATSLADAAHAIGQGAPDVILVDVDGDFGETGIVQMAKMSAARILAFTGSTDNAVCEGVILAGAAGVVSKREPTEILLHAIESVHAGEAWIDRRTVGRIFLNLSRRTRGDDHPTLSELTAKERQVVEQLMFGAGLPNRAIAERLHISENTLRNHLTSVYAKLGISSRAELHALLGCNGRKHTQ